MKIGAGEGKKSEMLGCPAEGRSTRLRGVRPNLGRTHENLEHPTDTPPHLTQHKTTQHKTTQHKTTQHTGLALTLVNKSENQIGPKRY